MTTGTGRTRSSATQEKIVAQKSHNRCAYPDCGAALVVEATSPLDSAKSVGKFAHICAASPGGPRYAASMTDVQRSSADNLIFLCGTHHDVIDSQLDYHTVAYLREAKAKHEARLSRAVRHALGEIGYADLETVCRVIGSIPVVSTRIDVPLAIAEKVELNGLSDGTQAKIGDGLAQAGRVAEFVEFQSRSAQQFGTRLASRFKASYYQGISDGLTPDDVFESILFHAYENSGPEDTPSSRAAALAVVSFLFERCEIFEHEPATP
ncbi:ABC-three component system protein [Arthrobacter sp. 754]|uniref:ABC-three component system protein n=1 Tax=Arthrobacter sp. 754 TaxID=3156315 RepID=UPI00339497D9